MHVHNIMEEIVVQRINGLYDQVKKSNSAWLSCDCENCRMDTISYVLNRIAPKYIVSGRGATHSISTMEDNQIRADIDALGLEGIRIVSTTKRPYHQFAKKEVRIETPTPVFNMPTFMGTILDGTTFEPLIGATIVLKQNGVPVEMIDQTWTNPVKTFKSTQGSYSFWAKAIPAQKEGLNQRFVFTVEVTAPDYTDVNYTFEVPVVSESSKRTELNSIFSLKIKDLIMFRSDIENPMEQDEL
ncbi:MAG: late competence development ComFB family protein [Treponema sp.]|nr:late competence development ComFB family protein [Treponema sp.]